MRLLAFPGLKQFAALHMCSPLNLSLNHLAEEEEKEVLNGRLSFADRHWCTLAGARNFAHGAASIGSAIVDPQVMSLKAWKGGFLLHRCLHLQK